MLLSSVSLAWVRSARDANSAKGAATQSHKIMKMQACSDALNP